MRRVIISIIALAACRPSDGASRNAPGASAAVASAPGGVAATAASTAPAAQGADSARDNALLERADAARIQGSKDAPVWVVEISDFQCPFCKRFHDDTYPAIKREFVDAGVVRMAYVNLPLQMHQNALPAAEAAMCAAAQGKFWEMHDALFDTQTQWAAMEKPARLIDSLAVAVGVDAKAWRDCMTSGLMRRLINGDKARAATSGARSTPTFFVGDEPIEGAAPIGVFRAAIARARAKTGRSPR